MKKFISLAVALAMILSVCPVLNAFAADPEAVTVDAVRAMFFNRDGAPAESIGDEGDGVSLLVSTGTDGWHSATSFTDLDRTVTEQASLSGTNFGSARNAFVAFELPDIDYDKLISAELSLTVHAVKQATGGQRIGVYANSLKDEWGINAAGKAALGASGIGDLEMLGFTGGIGYGNQNGATRQDETVTLSSQKLVQYLKDMKADGYNEVTFRLANNLGGIYIYNAAHANHPTLTLKTGDAVQVTIKSVLADGSDFGVEDKTVTAVAGEEYSYSNPTRVLEVGGEFYIFNEAASELSIIPTTEGENVIKLVYDKFDGTGLTGSVIADGATCWFADPRTLTVKGDGVDYTYIGYIDNYGNVKATQYDNESGDYEEVLVRSNLQPDDHNNPAFLELPDHHILIIYSRHTDEKCFYYRVSKQPYDITTLGEEKRLATADNTTYPNPYILSDDPDHVYMGWRGINWHPTIAQMTMPTAENDYTLTFTWGPKQVVQSTAARPYAKYTSNGKNEIWVTYTTGHPDNENPNWLYFNRIDVVDTHNVMDVNGNKLSNVDSGTLAVNTSNAAFAVDAPASGTRDWVWEVAVDERVEGEAKVQFPVIAMVKISADKQRHDYWYATYTGSKWQLTDLPDPSFNTYFHETPGTENCYSGGMSIDKANPHDVYASIPVDGVFGRVFEIVKYTLNADYTDVINTEYITENSRKDNARPYIANGSEEGDLRLTWFNGDYYFWIHDERWGGKGYPVQMMTDTELPELPVVNGLGDVTEEIYAIDGNTETVPVTAGEEFTISMNILQNDISVGGTLLKSGNLQIDLEKQTVDDTHDYAAVAPKLTVGNVVEKSQNLFSDASWYFGTNGTSSQKGEASLGWFNYTITYDGSELVTYVNGLIDATMQNVDVALGDEIELGGIDGIITNVRSTDVALTQAEVRAAAEEFEPADVNTLDLITLTEETVTDIILPAATADGKAITWSSSDPSVMDATGAVTRDGKAHEITLTAEAGGKTKEFTVTVLAKVDVMAENLLFYYDFNNVTDGIVPDVSGNGLDAEVKGTAAKFDGGKLDLTANTAAGWSTNGYLNVPSDFLQGVRSYTVVQKVQAGNSVHPRLYDFGSNSQNSVFTRVDAFSAGIKNSSTQLTDVKNVKLSSAEEQWVVTSYNAATGETAIYVNGTKMELSDSKALTHQAYTAAGAADRNYIGRTQWWDYGATYADDNQDFNGTIDNFMFFNTALTEEEIAYVTSEENTPAPIVSLGWNDEDFTINFTYSGDSVKIYKNDSDEPVVEGAIEAGMAGVAFYTADTNARYQAIGVTNGADSRATEVVSVYSLVAQAVADFAAENADTVITEAQLGKAIEVLNNGGIYLTNRKLTAEADMLMTLKDETDTITITLKPEIAETGIKFTTISKYASDKEEPGNAIEVAKDGKSITINNASLLETVIYLEDVEFVLESSESVADETVSGELDFIEEI